MPSLAAEATRLDEMRVDAFEDLVDAQLISGLTPDLGGVAQLGREHPYRERLWGLWARSLYRAGRQADALRTLAELRSTFGDELGIEPSPETVRLEEQILLHDPSLEARTSPATNLPVPVSSFVGRTEESAHLLEVLHHHRLVTVLGPGGVGKTRLAIEVARVALGDFRDGIWFLDLAQLSDATELPAALGAVLGVGDSSSGGRLESIVAFLRPRATLVVLDNCEHVAAPVASMTEALLAAAPRLRVLATSRTALGIPGEVHVDLAGLSTTPDAGELSSAEELFAARAGAVSPGFGVDEQNRASVLSVCRHLDGMPLAIELAAARAKTLAPVDIERHLQDRFALLSPEPAARTVHRSLLASMDWSYELLSPAVREVFDALGVFEGSFAAPAAAAVATAGSELETLNAIQTLADASMLQVVHRGHTGPHYRLLETQRLYARDHLAGHGTLGRFEHRHDIHYAASAAGLREAFFGRDRVAAGRRIESELADHNMAFDRLLAQQAPEAMAMGWAMGHVWLFGGHLAGGGRRLAMLLDSDASPSDDGRARADASTAASFLAMYDSRYDDALRHAEEAVTIYRRIGDRQGLAYALARAGHASLSVGRGPEALAQLTESIDVCREIGYDEGLAWPITLLAQARRWAGEVADEIREDIEDGRRRFIEIGETYGQAHADLLLASMYESGVDYRLRYAEEMVELAQAPGADRIIRSPALLSLANAVWDSGDRIRAQGLNRAAVRSALETGASVNVGLDLLQAATFAGHLGQAERAARLFGAGDRHFNMARAPFMERVYGEAIDAATAELGSERYEELHAEGGGLSLEQSVAYLLESSTPASDPLQTSR